MDTNTIQNIKKKKKENTLENKNYVNHTNDLLNKIFA
jgi:hypothetical protein